MKRKISISLDEEAIQGLESELGKDLFRSRSHIIEYAIKDFIKRKAGRV